MGSDFKNVIGDKIGYVDAFSQYQAVVVPGMVTSLRREQQRSSTESFGFMDRRRNIMFVEGSIR